jgi:hypothetical protein
MVVQRLVIIRSIRDLQQVPDQDDDELKHLVVGFLFGLGLEVIGDVHRQDGEALVLDE